MNRLVIAIDYDQTFTADTGLWYGFIAQAQMRGHTVVCVTGRSSPPDFHEPRLPDRVPLVLAGGSTYKRDAARKAGYHVNIWIDDLPQTIAPSLMFEDDGCPHVKACHEDGCAGVCRGAQRER